MRFDGHFKLLQDISSTTEFLELQDAIKNFDWTQDVFLALNAAEDPGPFKDCYIMQLFASPIMEQIRSDANDKPYTVETRKIIPLVRNVIDCVMKTQPERYLLKAHLAALKPFGCQVRHVDAHTYHHFARRFDIPIVTNPQSETIVENTVHKLVNGHVYEMNNVVTHYSANHGTTMRTHLFFDLVPENHIKILTDYYSRVKIKPMNRDAYVPKVI